MHRSPTRKRIELTARDIEIFKLLKRYRYLRSTYIHAFVGGASTTRFKERLGDLYHESYLDRPRQQWEFANARHTPAVYESGPGATRTLRGAGVTIDDTRTLLAGTVDRQFLHSLMICDVLASLDLGARADPRLRLITWPEILGRAPETTRSSPTPFRIPVPTGGYVVPDGLFGLEYAQNGTKAYRFFAVEADRDTMPVIRSNQTQTSYLGKLAAYRQIISKQVYQSHLAVPNLLILTITTNRARATGITSRMEGQTAANAAFLFKTVEPSGITTPAIRLLFEPWERAGLSPLRIDE